MTPKLWLTVKVVQTDITEILRTAEATSFAGTTVIVLYRNNLLTIQYIREHWRQIFLCTRVGLASTTPSMRLAL